MCCFTRGPLSKIETGKTTPPIATLTKIANAPGVKVSAFLEACATSNKTVFVPRDKTDPNKATLTRKSYGFIPILINRLGKVMRPYVFVAYKDQVAPQLLTHEGEDFIYLLECDVKYRVGMVEYAMTTVAVAGAVFSPVRLCDIAKPPITTDPVFSRCVKVQFRTFTAI